VENRGGGEERGEKEKGNGKILLFNSCEGPRKGVRERSRWQVSSVFWTGKEGEEKEDLDPTWTNRGRKKKRGSFRVPFSHEKKEVKRGGRKKRGKRDRSVSG